MGVTIASLAPKNAVPGVRTVFYRRKPEATAIAQMQSAPSLAETGLC
jgi:hypothetical protein